MCLVSGCLLCCPHTAHLAHQTHVIQRSTMHAHTHTHTNAQLTSDAAASVPPPDPILDGGSTPEERQAAFLELALCLSAGLPDAALDPLFAVRCSGWLLQSLPVLCCCRLVSLQARYEVLKQAQLQRVS